MNEDKDIARVKEAFEQELYQAPETLWDQIDEALDQEDEAVYGPVRDAFESSYQAPEGMWESIERGLTIDSTWTRVRSYLRWMDLTNRGVQLIGLFALLVISLPLADSQWPRSLSDDAASSSPAQTHQSLDEQIETSEPIADGPSNGALSQQHLTPVVLAMEAPNLPTSPPAGLTDRSAGTVAFHDPLLAPFGISGFPYDVQVMSKLGLIALLELDPVQKPPTRTGFAAGPVLMFNNPDLQNNTAKEAERSASNTESEISINFSVGLAGQYATPGGHLFEARYLHNKVMNQAFNRFESGAFVSQNLVMLYDQIDLRYHRAIWFNGATPSIFLGAGGYAAHLNAATLVKEDELENRTDRYSSWDAGLGVSVKKQWNAGPVIIDLDLNTEWGLQNIHRGDQLLPAQFDLTYTRNTSLNASVKYRF